MLLVDVDSELLELDVSVELVSVVGVLLDELVLVDVELVELSVFELDDSVDFVLILLVLELVDMFYPLLKTGNRVLFLEYSPVFGCVITRPLLIAGCVVIVVLCTVNHIV